MEPLEPRQLLAGDVGVFEIANVARFTPTSTDLADMKRGPLANAGSQLGNLYLDYRRALRAGRAFAAPNSVLDLRSDDKVGVTLRIRTNDLPKFIRGLSNSYGFEKTAVAAEYSVVQGYLPINWIRTLAARSDVAQISPIYTPFKNQRGIAGNQADQALRADIARSLFNLTGAGVKVGVLSDSVNSEGGGLQDSIDSGDLPLGIDVITDGGQFDDSDEGRAMLELIHDIAPSATLAFNTANGGQAAFAQGITNLSNASAKVLVDDIGYPDEPFFQEGVIDTAIRAAVADGATYLSSSGNSSNSGFSQTTRFIASGGKVLTDFDPGSGTATRMRVTINDGGLISFQYDNPYNGLIGSATADVDITFYDAGTNTVAFSGTDDNLVTGRPLETVFAQPGQYDVEIELSQLETGATAPTRFKFVGDVGLSTTQFIGDRSSVFGHAASNAGISVAAVPFFGAPPFSNAPLETEEFTSLGGGVYVFSANGARLANPIVTQKPDFSAIDGGNTSFFGDDIFNDSDTLPNFFGTSAAAPNAAAVVALIKQANPIATQAQILSVLKSTARPVNGTPQNVWDPSGGFGLMDAAAAVPQLGLTPTATITPVSPDPTTVAIDTVVITFNQVVTGFNRADLTLSRNGGPNLLTNAQQLTTTDGITFTLTNLDGLTAVNGTYTLTLTAAGSGIMNVTGIVLTQNAVETFTKIEPPTLPARTSGLTATTNSATSITVRFNDASNNEDSYEVQRALNSTFTSGVKTFRIAANSTSFVNTGLNGGTRYYFRVRARNVTGAGRYSSTASAVTALTGELILDNDSSRARVRGFWGASTTGNFVGANYLQDGNSAKGTKFVTYSPAVSGSGQYYVYARWTRASNRATNVPFDIFYGPNAGLVQTILVDQRNRGGDAWVLIGGPFQMNFGAANAVRIRNSGTNGVVVADAIRLLPAGPIVVPKPVKPTKNSFSPQSNKPNPFGKTAIADPDEGDLLNGPKATGATTLI